ncbi:Uridine-cytidine kinase [Populus alba x Populus x berolinensis]|nr:Uridine-cytidine kinase [Populus alba x Populus x berolinensis]
MEVRGEKEKDNSIDEEKEVRTRSNEGEERYNISKDGEKKILTYSRRKPIDKSYFAYSTKSIANLRYNVTIFSFWVFVVGCFTQFPARWASKTFMHHLEGGIIKVQGKERLYVKYVGEQLGLDGSYVPRTYIEQIQLEKLVNDVMALPDDLKTKLSIEDDLVSSPKEALSRASADRRNKYLGRSLSLSYSNQREKNLSKLTRLAVNNRRFDGRTIESPAAVANQGVITQLSEQISTLNERMDEFTSRIEELNSKFSTRKVSASQQNLALQGEPCNGSGPTSLFVTGLGNGSLTGSILPNSSSSSQLTRESPLMEEPWPEQVLLIARGQRQIMHQLDNLTNLLHEHRGERSRADTINSTVDIDSITFPLILALAVGGLGVLLFSSMTPRK